MTPSRNPDSNDDQNEPKSKKIPYHFGEKLRQAREHRGYTLKVVAQRAGVSESLVSQIERNHVSPAIDTLLSLADVLDINLEYLFEEYRKERPVHIIRSQARASVTEHEVLYEELARPDSSTADSTTECYIIKIPAGLTLSTVPLVTLAAKSVLSLRVVPSSPMPAPNTSSKKATAFPSLLVLLTSWKTTATHPWKQCGLLPRQRDSQSKKNILYDTMCHTSCTKVKVLEA